MIKIDMNMSESLVPPTIVNAHPPKRKKRLPVVKTSEGRGPHPPHGLDVVASPHQVALVGDGGRAAPWCAS